MRNKFLKVFTLLLAIMLMCVNVISVSAAEIEPDIDDPIDVNPYENCIYCRTSFSISSTGEASAVVSYRGNPDTFTHIKSTIKIQKQVFWFIWSDVEINSNNQWVDDYYSIENVISHTYNLSETGTYRAVFNIEVYGTSGVTDTVNDTIQDTY